MKQINIILTLAVLLAALTATLVQAAPPLPARFYGTVQLNGTNVPAGTLVSAWIGGVKYAETATFLEDGDSVFLLDVSGDDPDTTAIEGGVEGQTIAFQVAGFEADQTGVWSSGAYNRLDLTATASTPDLVISKDDGRTTVLPGETLTYTLTISVTGSQGANSVAVIDTRPRHTTFLTASDGGSEAGGVVTWPAFGLAGGTNATRTVTIQIDELLPIGLDVLTNTVTVAEGGSLGLDPTPENNTDFDINIIADPGPRVEAGPNQTAAEGDRVSLPEANFTDLGPLTTHSATIDWGDGVVEAGVVNESGGTGTISATHVYGDDGPFTVEICVADEGTGATGCDSLQVAVANAAPVSAAPLMAFVDLQQWTEESYPPASNAPQGEWLVAPDGASVLQIQNGVPTLFYSDFEMSTTRAEGYIRVETNNDDDFIGFVFGFQPGDTTNSNAEYLLVDWKRGSQNTTIGCKAGASGPRGLAVSRVFGIPDVGEFWGHTNFDAPACPGLNHGVEELARAINLGDNGWQRFTDYKFTFQYSPTRLLVFVNDVLELDINGDFPAGRLAFFNFSQAQVRYSAFAVDELNIDEGAMAELTHTFVDPGTLDTHSATIDWGDGTSEIGLVSESDGRGTVSGSHVYADDGVFTAEVCVTDDDGGIGCDSLSVNVSNVAPVLASVDLQRWTAESYPPVPGFPEGEWLVAPDGASVLQVQNGQPTFFYSDFEVSQAQIAGHIQVNTTNDDDFIGFAFGFQPGDTTNPKAEYLLIDWKRGSQNTTIGCRVGTYGPRGLAISRVFGIPDVGEFWGHANFDGPDCPDLNHGLEELARAINLGDTGWQRFTDYKFTFQYSPTRLEVFVDDVLELDIIGNFPAGRLAFLNFSQAQVRYSAFELTALSADEGAAAPLKHTFTDAGILDTHSATIDWGDGRPMENGYVTEIDGAGSVSGTHVYADNGQYSAQVCVSDDDGGVGCDTIDVTVLNLPPAVEAGPNLTGYVGYSLSLLSAGFTDPGIVDTHTAVIDWGDGSPSEIGIVSGSKGSGSVSGSHTYTVTGSHTVALCVTDDDGEKGCDTFEANILVNSLDLTITKDDGQTSVQPGATLTYTLTISNVGNQDATGVAVTDTLPIQGAAFIAASNGGTEASGVVTWPTFELVTGAGVTRTVTIRVDDPLPEEVDTLTNTATVTDDGLNGPDSNPANNIAHDQDRVETASYGSIRIEKSTGLHETNNSFRFLGDLGTFELTRGQSQTFTSLLSGTYVVAEDPTSFPDSHWLLLSVQCVDQTGQVVPVVFDWADQVKAEITVQANQALHCVYLNERSGFEEPEDVDLIYLPLIIK